MSIVGNQSPRVLKADWGEFKLLICLEPPREWVWEGRMYLTLSFGSTNHGCDSLQQKSSNLWRTCSWRWAAHTVMKEFKKIENLTAHPNKTCYFMLVNGEPRPPDRIEWASAQWTMTVVCDSFRTYTEVVRAVAELVLCTLSTVFYFIIKEV